MPGTVIATYRTAGGRELQVFKDYRDDYFGLFYSWQCPGCTAEAPYEKQHDKDKCLQSAQKHAASCTAV